MIIKIDVDGVIRNINETMCKMYNDLFDENLTVEDMFDYDVEKVFKKFKEEYGMTAVDYFFNWSSKDVFLRSNPYDGVREAIQKLRDAGHKVVIVTWQFSLQNKYYTLLFFEKNKIPYDDICFTKDKWMIQGDWLIDDNPEFIEDKRDKSKKILINMPYNKKVLPFLQRANNLQEAVDIILKREEIVIPIEAVEVNNYKNMFNCGTD
jgi:uncharacterized HAD superfamily protein